jgi:hypothetical protein
MPKNRGHTKALGIAQTFFPNVTEVKDASKDLIFKVTETDVRKARHKDHLECVLARACKRSFGVSTIMALKTCYIIQGNTAIRYKVPERAAREIVAFDRGASFSPGEYRFKAPSKREKLGVSHRPSGKKPYKKSVKRYRTSDIRSVLGSQLVHA